MYRSSSAGARLIALVAVALFANAAAAAEERDLAASLRELKLMNYYPVDAAQSRMWSNWKPAAIERDFARIAAMNANAVRVQLFIPEFEYPVPSKRMLDRLEAVLQLADKHGLRVKLGLFGFFSRYADQQGSETWASAVLERLKDDRRLAYIDLQNEMNPTRAEALAWAVNLLPKVRAAAGDVPITISVSGDAGVPGLRALKEALAMLPDGGVDFFELHYYGNSRLAHRTFEEAKALAAPKPLFIGEAGYSTDVSRRENKDASWAEWQQDQFLRTVQFAANARELGFVAPWIFQDFRPGAFPASKSGSDPAEYRFGLYRTDGIAKPAGSSYAKIFGGSRVDVSFNNGFEDADGAGQPANWLRWKPEHAQFARDTTVNRTGLAAARISRSSADATVYPAFSISPVQFITPGRKYVVGAWARGEELTGTSRIALAWFDAAGKFLGNNFSLDVPLGNSSWRPLTATGVAPAEAAYMEIHLASSNNRGTVWFDDVTFDAR